MLWLQAAHYQISAGSFEPSTPGTSSPARRSPPLQQLAERLQLSPQQAMAEPVDLPWQLS
jgi:hypothetical protein